MGRKSRHTIYDPSIMDYSNRGTTADPLSTMTRSGDQSDLLLNTTTAAPSTRTTTTSFTNYPPQSSVIPDDVRDININDDDDEDEDDTDDNHTDFETESYSTERFEDNASVGQGREGNYDYIVTSSKTPGVPTMVYRDDPYSPTNANHKRSMSSELHLDLTESQRRSSRWSKLALGILAVVILLVAAVALHRNKHAAPASSSTNPEVLTALAPLPPPPQNLSSLCAFSAIQDNHMVTDVANNEGLYLSCLQACEVADCCDYPPELELSCLQGNEEVCMAYHKDCGNLLATAVQSNTTIKPAPPEVADFCSPSSLATNVGIRSCARYCLPVECCWEQGVASCTSNPNCAGYSPCLHLRASDEAVMSIEEIVAEKCASNMLQNTSGIIECQAACEPAKCCYDTTICPEKLDTSFCGAYDGCVVLYDGTVSTQALTQASTISEASAATIAWNNATNFPDQPPDLPPGISVACDAAFINDDSHLTTCEDDCAGAACCKFPVGQNKSCLVGFRKQCYKYNMYCSVLDGSLVANPNPDAVQNIDMGDVEDACNINSLSTTAGYQLCERYCNASSCCWSDTVELHCRDNQLCEKYSACLNFKALTHVNPAIKDAVDQICTATRIATPAGRAMCDQLCSQHKCCYNATATACPFEDPAICNQYSSCSVLNTAVQGFAALPAFPPNLVGMCYNLSSAEDQIKCSETCKAAECCLLPENLPTSCLKTNHDICIDFHRACSALTYGNAQDETISIPTAHNNLQDVCSPRSLATAKGHKRCVRLCQPARCCYSKLLQQGQLPCTISQEDKCTSYAPCLNLEAGAYSDTQTAVVQEVQDKCTAQSIQDAQGRAICQAVCTQHSCCWASRQPHLTNVDDDNAFDDDYFDDDDDVIDDATVAADDDNTTWAQGDDDNLYDPTSGVVVPDSEIPSCVNETVCALFDGCKLLNLPLGRLRKLVQQMEEQEL